MNAQQLAALGTMVREAIETHVTAAVKAMSEEFGKQLSERDQQIETLTAQLQQLQSYDDTEIKQAVQALRENPPTPYDDSEIKQMVADLGGAIVDAEMRLGAKQAQDAESLLGRISDVAKMVADRPAPADGRDALQLEVLPAIDEAKSYTRGTYAKHAGGLWRSFEQTSGMRGWECIVDGISFVGAELVGKELHLSCVQSSGSRVDLKAHIPVQTYKGVFAHGEHEQGDTVTWAGSLWHCNVTGTKALPGDGSADWTLAVKKGRDGREVVKTERKEGPVQL